MSARDLFEWNGEYPNVRTVLYKGPPEHATPLYCVVADYGWAERIICEGCYDHDAEAIVAAIQEVLSV